MKIIELLQEYRIPYKNVGEHHHATSGFVQIDCPFCSRDSQQFRMGISLSGSYASCWVCGYHPIFRTLAELTGISLLKCKKLLWDIEIEKKKEEKLRGKLVIPKGVGELLPAHIRYLRSRKFNPDKLQKLWKIQGIGIAGLLSWRIFIPIYYRGERVSWTTRSISDSKRVTRYISASPEEEAVSHKELLYGEDYVKHSIIITEGSTDVWKIGPGAVATLGLVYTQAQVNRMVDYPVRVVCFDASDTAQKRAKKLCDDISVFPGETFNITLDSKDPGEASEKEIQRIRRRFLI